MVQIVFSSGLEKQHTEKSITHKRFAACFLLECAILNFMSKSVLSLRSSFILTWNDLLWDFLLFLKQPQQALHVHLYVWALHWDSELEFLLWLEFLWWYSVVNRKVGGVTSNFCYVALSRCDVIIRDGLPLITMND